MGQVERTGYLRVEYPPRLRRYFDEAHEVGSVIVAIDLENYADRVLADRGYLEPSAVRNETVRVLADSGATMLVLPQDLVERLGLRIGGEKVVVTYADDRKDERPIVWDIRVSIGNRHMLANCIVGPPASQGLLGQVILEQLDLLVDCKERKLVPRPESPYLPSLSLK